MKFSKDALERVTATVVIVLAAVATVAGAVESTGLLQEEWQQLLAIPAVALVLNVLKVYAATGFGDRGTASFVAEEHVADEAVVETAPETDEQL